jgi:hypothetical protein
MADPMDVQAALHFAFKLLNGRIDVLSSSLYRTRRDLIALAGLLAQKGIAIDPDEWEAAGKELDAAHQLELALDPRLDKGTELLRRILAGETVSDEEMNAWLRDVHGGA